MILTADEYFTFTGYLAPADFASCLAIAEQQIHAETLYAYVDRDISELPSMIQITLKQALALQTCAVSQNGGVAGMSQQPQSSVSLGKFSYSAGNNAAVVASTIALSPAVRAVLPLLVSYGRGLQSCCPSR